MKRPRKKNGGSLALGALVGAGVGLVGALGAIAAIAHARGPNAPALPAPDFPFPAAEDGGPGNANRLTWWLGLPTIAGAGVGAYVAR